MCRHHEKMVRKYANPRNKLIELTPDELQQIINNQYKECKIGQNCT